MCARGPAASTWCFEPTTYNDDYDNNSIGCIYLHTQIHQAVYITMKLNQLRSPHSAVIGPGFSVLTIRFGWQCEHCFVYLLCLHYIFTSWPLSFDCYAFAVSLSCSLDFELLFQNQFFFSSFRITRLAFAWVMHAVYYIIKFSCQQQQNASSQYPWLRELMHDVNRISNSRPRLQEHCWTWTYLTA